jgi:ABC-2 type transport system ATP-binding protein
MIETRNLTKLFGEFIAVRDINLTVPAGTVYAVLGPNGAGKTTTVRMLTSILRPTSGSATVAGYDVVTQSAQVRASVGVLTEQHGLYERMRALEYLDFFGRVYALPTAVIRKRGLQLMDRFGLSDAIDKRLGEYSKGMKQKLALVRAMLHDPLLLLLDEPTSAMDPQSAKLVREAIVELRRDKRTVILTTHNLAEAQLLADQIGVIRRGRMIASGTFDDLARRFVGEPIMHLKVGGSLNGTKALVSEQAEVIDEGLDWLRYKTPTPHTTNPSLIKHLTEHGTPIITLSEVQESLENVYLNIVQEDEAIAKQEQLARQGRK